MELYVVTVVFILFLSVWSVKRGVSEVAYSLTRSKPLFSFAYCLLSL